MRVVFKNSRIIDFSVPSIITYKSHVKNPVQNRNTNIKVLGINATEI